MPVDHYVLTVPSSALDPLVTWLTTSLSHLNIHEMMRPLPNVVGMGDGKNADFWLNTVENDSKELREALGKGHIAFAATDEKQVQTFHAQALAAGGKDNGKPGLRFYHPGYYGAFVIDPVIGLNWEVVFHGAKPE